MLQSQLFLASSHAVGEVASIFLPYIVDAPRFRWLHVETGGPTAQRSSFVREESFQEEGNLETKSSGETVKRVTEYHRVFQRPLS